MKKILIAVFAFLTIFSGSLFANDFYKLFEQIAQSKGSEMPTTGKDHVDETAFEFKKLVQTRPVEFAMGRSQAIPPSDYPDKARVEQLNSANEIFNRENAELIKKDPSKAKPTENKLSNQIGPSSKDEQPQHMVVIEEEIEMQRTEFTQLQWSMVMGDNPSDRYKDSVRWNISGQEVEMIFNRPVENISFTDIEAFVEELNKLAKEYKHNYMYRLPTEAEWECAAWGNAKDDRGFCFGDGKSSAVDYGWFIDDPTPMTYEQRHRPHDVALKLPNGLGLFDMCGNVSERVSDIYSDTYYGDFDTFIDPKGPLDDPKDDSDEKTRVKRGGSWADEGQYYRVYYRSTCHIIEKSNDIGFRLVRTKFDWQKEEALEELKKQRETTNAVDTELEKQKIAFEQNKNRDNVSNKTEIEKNKRAKNQAKIDELKAKNETKESANTKAADEKKKKDEADTLKKKKKDDKAALKKKQQEDAVALKKKELDDAAALKNKKQKEITSKTQRDKVVESVIEQPKNDVVADPDLDKLAQDALDLKNKQDNNVVENKDNVVEKKDDVVVTSDPQAERCQQEIDNVTKRMDEKIAVQDKRITDALTKYKSRSIQEEITKKAENKKKEIMKEYKKEVKKIERDCAKKGVKKGTLKLQH
ncbi:MAG: SUMF1/EgtB/PvdO family nonheme iron enzyme [Pseudomonadota bacterium]